MSGKTSRGNHYIIPSCNLCQDCVDICPTDSIYLGIKQYVVDLDTCIDCGICRLVCLHDSVRNVDELVIDFPEDGEPSSVEPGLGEVSASEELASTGTAPKGQSPSSNKPKA